MTNRHHSPRGKETGRTLPEDTIMNRQADIIKGIGYPSMREAIEVVNQLGYPWAVQLWTGSSVRPDEYVVSHGSADGVGRTVYATIPAGKDAK